MTIKEMSKLYKKVSKLEDMYDSARYYFTDANCIAYERNLEQATNMCKALKGLKKIADAMAIDTLELLGHTISEESFLRWMLVNDINIVANEEDEEEVQEEA